MVPLYYSKITMVPQCISMVPTKYMLITTVTLLMIFLLNFEFNLTMASFFFFLFPFPLPALLPWLLHLKPDNDPAFSWFSQFGGWVKYYWSYCIPICLFFEVIAKITTQIVLISIQGIPLYASNSLVWMVLYVGVIEQIIKGYFARVLIQSIWLVGKILRYVFYWKKISFKCVSEESGFGYIFPN